MDPDASIPRSTKQSISSLSLGSKSSMKLRRSTKTNAYFLPPTYQGPREGIQVGDIIYDDFDSSSYSLSYSSSSTEQSADKVEQEQAYISGLSSTAYDTTITTCSSHSEHTYNDLQCGKKNEDMRSWAFLADDHLVQAHYDGDAEDLIDILFSWGDRGGWFSFSLLPVVISKSVNYIRRSYRSTPVLYAGNLQSFQKK